MVLVVGIGELLLMKLLRE
uniref:Uncharacterized protein n=1 Tax=Rhizophora mucronata TaxID=61149 RepID=A0A2P2L2M1_RHIMU